MYDRNEDGSIWVPMERYYGELDFTMGYKGEATPVFPWLYLHEKLFKDIAVANGFHFKVVQRGNNFDYLFRFLEPILNIFVFFYSTQDSIR